MSEARVGKAKATPGSAAGGGAKGGSGQNPSRLAMRPDSRTIQQDLHAIAGFQAAQARADALRERATKAWAEVWSAAAADVTTGALPQSADSQGNPYVGPVLELRSALGSVQFQPIPVHATEESWAVSPDARTALQAAKAFRQGSSFETASPGARNIIDRFIADYERQGVVLTGNPGQATSPPPYPGWQTVPLP